MDGTLPTLAQWEDWIGPLIAVVVWLIYTIASQASKGTKKDTPGQQRRESAASGSSGGTEDLAARRRAQLEELTRRRQQAQRSREAQPAAPPPPQPTPAAPAADQRAEAMRRMAERREAERRTREQPTRRETPPVPPRPQAPSRSLRLDLPAVDEGLSEAQLGQRMESYRRAIAFLDQSGPMTYESFKRVHRVAGLNVSERQLGQLWQIRDQIRRDPGMPADGAERLRMILRTALIEAAGAIRSHLHARRPTPQRMAVVETATVGHEGEVHRHVPDVQTVVAAPSRRNSARPEHLDRDTLRQAIILKELLDKPLALRDSDQSHLVW